MKFTEHLQSEREHLLPPGEAGGYCYQCEKAVAYIFADGRCKDCTRLTPDEVRGTE